MTAETVPVIFTLPELWVLHDFVRHESADSEAWRFPAASVSLNEEIAFAIETCETHHLPDYALQLSKGDLLIIDFLIRRDLKSPEGVKGKDILLKVFRGRKYLAGDIEMTSVTDRTYEEVKNASTATTANSGPDADDDDAD